MIDQIKEFWRDNVSFALTIQLLPTLMFHGEEMENGGTQYYLLILLPFVGGCFIGWKSLGKLRGRQQNSVAGLALMLLILSGCGGPNPCTFEYLNDGYLWRTRVEQDFGVTKGDTVVIRHFSSTNSPGVRRSFYGNYVGKLPADNHDAWWAETPRGSKEDSSYQYMLTTYNLAICKQDGK